MRLFLILLIVPMLAGCGQSEDGIDWPASYSLANHDLPEGYVLPEVGSQIWYQINGSGLGMEQNPGPLSRPEGAQVPEGLRGDIASVMTPKDGQGRVLVLAQRWDTVERAEEYLLAISQATAVGGGFPCWWMMQEGPVIIRITSDAPTCDAAEHVVHSFEGVGATVASQVYRD